MSKIIVAADHGGLACKNEIKAWLTAAGIQVVDVGAEKLVSDDDYSTWARAAVVAKKADTVPMMELKEHKDYLSFLLYFRIFVFSHPADPNM